MLKTMIQEPATSERDIETTSPPNRSVFTRNVPPGAREHYYGHIVRKLFLVVGTIMLLSLPLFNSAISMSTLLLVAAILTVSILAGLTNPMQFAIVIADIIVSIVGLLVFEFHAITNIGQVSVILLMIDQVLALTFFFALYYSTKTIRGRFTYDELQEQQQLEAEAKRPAPIREYPSHSLPTSPTSHGPS